MNTSFDDPIKTEVWETLRALNAAWTRGNPDDLATYFHPEMVAIAGPERRRIEGGPACVASWKAFTQAAKIRRWLESEPRVDLYGDTAVVTYYYDMAFEMGGQTVDTGGRDMFVFVRERGRWRAVADQFSPYPAASAAPATQPAGRTQSLISWFEIPAVDFERATRFYEAVFAVSLQRGDIGGGRMGVFPYSAPATGGCVFQADLLEPGRSGVVIYLDGGDDLAVPLGRVEPAGGKVVLPKTLISAEIGYMAHFDDCEGNRIGLHSPH